VNIYPTTQRLCAWSGLIGVIVFFSGMVLASFFPPPSPSWSVEAVAAHYQEHATGIRIGMLLMMISGMFIAPLVALISVHLRRLEKGTPLMTYTQLAAGTSGILFFIIPGVIFLITAFRPDRPPELTYLMNDFSWIITVLPWPSAFMQNVAIAVCIFNHPGNPIFPRWVAYFNLWIALGFLPGSMLVFFKSGAFAWNGLFPFWFAGTVFFVWFVTMLVVLLGVIRRQEAETAAR
jgi:hypothetical protein